VNKRLVSLSAAVLMLVVGSSANAVTIVAAPGALTGSVPNEQGGPVNFSAPSSGSFPSGTFTENGISFSPTTPGQGGSIVSGTHRPAILLTRPATSATTWQYSVVVRRH
jgi:hypothetical protein